MLISSQFDVDLAVHNFYFEQLKMSTGERIFDV